MARKTKDEAEKTKNAILDAAETLFFERGVTRTSLEQIATAAQVTRGAVYWHFRDKVELFEAMMHRVFLPHEDMLEELASRDSDTPLQDMKESNLYALKLLETDPHRRKVVTILLFRCEYVEAMAGLMVRRAVCKQRMLELSEKLFIRAKKLGQLAPHWTPKGAAAAMHALVGGLIIGALEQPEKTSGLLKTGATCIEAFYKSLQK